MSVLGCSQGLVSCCWEGLNILGKGGWERFRQSTLSDCMVKGSEGGTDGVSKDFA